MAAPTAMAMSSDGSVLAMSAAGGYKSADPILRIIRFDQDDQDRPRVLPVVRQDPGLSNVAQALEMDNERKCDPSR